MTAGEDFLDRWLLPSSAPSCTTPGTLTAINPADVPDELNQVSGSVGAPIVKDKTFLFVAADYTRQDRTTFLSSTLPAFVLPAAVTGCTTRRIAPTRWPAPSQAVWTDS